MGLVLLMNKGLSFRACIGGLDGGSFVISGLNEAGSEVANVNNGI